jgi:cholesterol oxidase
MSATSLYDDGVKSGLASFLAAEGYDVWLFDYRAGVELPSAEAQFTIDDIANFDWPRAIEEVLRISGAHTVQAFGHCVGSVSLLMAILDRTNDLDRKVRSVVCAQFTLHPVTSKVKVVESDLHVGVILQGLRQRLLRPDTNRTAGHVALDLALRAIPLPKGEACQLPVCRWINAIYGLTHCHDQLEDETHQALPDLFGVANIRALEHLGLMMQRGRAVDARGRDRYLENANRLAPIPILLLAGERNYIFHPEGASRTMRWLEDNGAMHATLHSLPDYGHLDALIGRDAARDVFPVVLGHLDSYQQRATKLAVSPTPTA